MKKLSKNESGFSLVELLLVLVLLAVIGGVGYMVYHNDHKTTTDSVATKSSTSTSKKTNTTSTNSPTGWLTYSSTQQGLSFKYPATWHVSQAESGEQTFISNYKGINNIGDAPSDYQEVEISTWPSELSQVYATLPDLQAGKPANGDSGTPTASTIQAKNVTIKAYEYISEGGLELDAFWSNTAGQEYYATDNSATSGVATKAAQQSAESNLKLILATIELNK